MIDIIVTIVHPALTYFICMLNGSFESTGDTHQDVFRMEQYIQSLLQEGRIATQTVEGHTPLMLYAYFNITDKRFKAELTKGCFYIREAILLLDKVAVNALTFAAGKGSLEALIQLHDTLLFFPGHLELAAYFAAAMNALNSIQYLKNAGVNLIAPQFTYNLTALHAICEAGYAEIVKEILTSKPDESLIQARVFGSQDTVYTLVQNNHQECVILLQETFAGAWEAINKAIGQKDVAKLQSIFTKPSRCDFNIGIEKERHISLIGLAATALPKGETTAEVYEVIFNYHTKSSPSTQINALLLGLSLIRQCMRVEAPTKLSCYQKLVQELNLLAPQFDMVDRLSINGIHLDMTIFSFIEKIISKNRVLELDFTHFFPERIHDLFTGGAYDVNLVLSSSPRLLALLLENTSILKCNLQLTPTYRPVTDLIALILQRNKEIAEAFQSTIHTKNITINTRNSICERYIPEINERIYAIKSNILIDDTQHLQEIERKVPKLKEITAFWIANSGHAFNLEDIAPEEKELVQKATLNFS